VLLLLVELFGVFGDKGRLAEGHIAGVVILLRTCLTDWSVVEGIVGRRRGLLGASIGHLEAV
jgi:hypothetical protein